MCAPSLPHGPHGIKWTRRQKRPHPGGHCEAFSRRAGEGRARGETCPRSGDSPRIDAESHCVCLQVTHGKEDLEGMIDVAAEAIIEVRRAARTPPACASVVGARRAKDWPVSQQSSDRGVIITPKFGIGSSGGGGAATTQHVDLCPAASPRHPVARPSARVRASCQPALPCPQAKCDSYSGLQEWQDAKDTFADAAEFYGALPARPLLCVCVCPGLAPLPAAQ